MTKVFKQFFKIILKCSNILKHQWAFVEQKATWFCTQSQCYSQLTHRLAILSACQKEGIMPIVKEVSDYLRKRIIEILVKECPAGRFAEINVPFPTVYSIICKFKQHGTTINLTQSAAPRKINAWSSRILHRKVKNNPDDYSK